jgi:nucleoside-diphosphate kinase
MKETTLSIIKPDAVKSNNIGDIISRFEKKGLRPIAMKMVQLTKEKAAQFYAIHRERPFFQELVDFISSGPVVLMVLEGINAVNLNRELMGATDPSKAAAGTIRKDFAKSIGENAVHGSDSLENAKIEIALLFDKNELTSRCDVSSNAPLKKASFGGCCCC